MKWLMTLGIVFLKTVYFEIIINSQEVAKDSTARFHVTFPLFPCVVIFCMTTL